jgi:hypothetical protein
MIRLLRHFASWFSRKGNPRSLTGSQWTGTHFTDVFRRNREPTPNELLSELKGTAWTCASLNAAVCAAYPPRLFVATGPNQLTPRCLTRALDPDTEMRLRSLPHLPRAAKAARLEEVVEHPLLALLAQVNPVHNAFDLWELTTLYQEVHGSAYWYLVFDPFLNAPREIWVLPTQNVTPRRQPNSPRLVDYYEYRTGAKEHRFRPDEIIHFRYPDPRDPYTAGLSPLRACFEQVSLASEYSAYKSAKFANFALPDAIISPDTGVLPGSLQSLKR